MRLTILSANKCKSNQKIRRKTMNKKSAIEAVKAAMPNLTMKEAETAVNTTLQSIVNGLERDGEVTLTNFGTFKVREVAQHFARNPQNGALLLIPARKRVAFKPAGKVMDRLDKTTIPSQGEE